jgi:hypothetical protein
VGVGSTVIGGEVELPPQPAMDDSNTAKERRHRDKDTGLMFILILSLNYGLNEWGYRIVDTLRQDKAFF